MDLGEFIRIRKKELNITTDFIAARLGVHRSNVFRWERGDTDKISYKYIEPLAEILRCSPIDIVLLGNPNYKQKSDDLLIFPTTLHEQKIIKKYRDMPEMQPAIDRILGIYE